MQKLALSSLLLSWSAVGAGSGASTQPPTRSIRRIVDADVKRQLAEGARPTGSRALVQDETHGAVLASTATARRRTHGRRDPGAREGRNRRIPADGNLMGDWKKGEKLAQSGYGGRSPTIRRIPSNGGNCYACHQMAKAEVSYGTLGPSLADTARSASSARSEARQAYATRSTIRRRCCPARTCRGSAATRCSRAADQGCHGLPDVARQPGEQVAAVRDRVRWRRDRSRGEGAWEWRLCDLP